MGLDYYGLLGVSRNCAAADIKAGYRLAAGRWHPQKDPLSKVECEARFRSIAEAYDVLIDPKRRVRYDKFGEQGLKFPPAGSDYEPYQYVGDPFSLFTSFCASANPLGAAYAEDLSGCAPGISEKEQEPPIELEVTCSLTELQDGTTRRLLVSVTRLGPDLQPYTDVKAVSLPIRAGWEDGTRMRFRNEGNHTSPDKQPGDIVVLIREQRLLTSNSELQAAKAGIMLHAQKALTPRVVSAGPAASTKKKATPGFMKKGSSMLLQGFKDGSLHRVVDAMEASNAAAEAASEKKVLVAEAPAPAPAPAAEAPAPAAEVPAPAADS